MDIEGQLVVLLWELELGVLEVEEEVEEGMS